MNIIAKKALIEFGTIHPQAIEPLDQWYKTVRKSNYSNFADVQEDFGSVDFRHGYLMFNIGGNKYRLVVTVNFQYKTFWIKFIGTHKEYDLWWRTTFL